MFLQDYDYSLEHRANVLSRVHNSVLVLEGNTYEHTLALKQNCDTVQKIKTMLESTEHHLLELRNGLVYRKSKDSILFYVPADMEYSVLHMYHNRFRKYMN